jgi:hypothetical protein
MAIDSSAPRSRRALLAAAAGGAAALAASAALPLGVAAHDADDLQLGVDNPTTATTSVSNATADLNAFGAAATGAGIGIESSSTGGAGVVGWSISASPFFDPAEDGEFTGVFGYSPAHTDPGMAGVGVWGDSADFGVYGTGSIGVFGRGGIGVIGESEGAAPAILALASTATDIALEVEGKVLFSRSGRTTVAKNTTSKKVTLAGVNANSRIFAVCYSNRSSRWVRAAVPHAGYFTIYMNAKVSAATYVSWFVIN